MTTYTTNCLTSLYAPSLRPLLDQLHLVILDERDEHGFTTTIIQCDAEAATKIGDAGWHIAEEAKV
jgi:hypothetical protein